MLWPKVKTSWPLKEKTCILSEEIKFICSFPTNAPEPSSISVFLALQKQQSAQNIMFFQILDLDNKLIKGHRGANV